MNKAGKTGTLEALQKIAQGWQPPELPEDIKPGDMPGDVVSIHPEQVGKAQRIFPILCGLLETSCQENRAGRAVVAVCGGSGSGKSGMAALLSQYLRMAGIGAYTLSGDNYPRRIPRDNDAERLFLFRSAGVQGMLGSGVYTPERAEILKELWEKGTDSAPETVREYPWLAVYQAEGRKKLAGYLGSPHEQDFQALSQVVSQFKNGADSIWLKRMGRTDTALWYDEVDFSGVSVLVIEWTHGNSDYYSGVDIPILLNSTPQETMAYRLLRGRDSGADSPFVTMVLEIEQRLLESQAHKAKIILAKTGEVLSYRAYRELMAQATEEEKE